MVYGVGGAVPGLGGVAGVVPGLGGVASGVAGSVIGAGLGSVFDAASQLVANGALWLLDRIGRLLSATTSAGLGTSWFEANASVMSALAAIVVLPMAAIGAIQAVYRQSGAVLTRSFLVNLPLAGLLTAVCVELVRLALAVTDTLSDRVLSAGGVETAHLLPPVVNFLGTYGLASGAPPFVVFVAALLVVVGAFVLWLELVVRAAAVAAATLFLPLVLATLVWPAVSHWCRRLAETIAALVLSKFVIAAVLSLAAGALAGGLGSDGTNGGGFAAVVTGIALLVVAAMSPFTLLKLVPAIEAGAVAHLESARHRLVSPARSAVRLGAFASDVAAGAAGGASAAGVVPEPGETATGPHVTGGAGEGGLSGEGGVARVLPGVMTEQASGSDDFDDEVLGAFGYGPSAPGGRVVPPDDAEP